MKTRMEYRVEFFQVVSNWFYEKFLDVKWYIHWYFFSNQRPIYLENREFLESFEPGQYVIGHNYHPSIVLRVDICPSDVYGSDIDVFDLVGMHESSISLMHSVPEIIDEEKATKLLEVYKQEGDRGLAKCVGGWTDETYDEFEKNWR